jgi:acyl transferase domain-containing protein
MSKDEETAAGEAMALGWEKRSLEEAIDEVFRECQVRMRCFPRWVQEGRVSRSDAKDRLQRLLKAQEALKAVEVSLDGIPQTDAT